VGVKDILWLRHDGGEMTDEEWNQQNARTLGVFLSGSALEEVDERGQPVTDENFLLLMNAHHEELPFRLPTAASGMRWVALIDTSCKTSRSPGLQYDAGTTYPLQARSLALLVERQRDQVRQERRNGT
jgi:isoamylase